LVKAIPTIRFTSCWLDAEFLGNPIPLDRLPAMSRDDEWTSFATANRFIRKLSASAPKAKPGGQVELRPKKDTNGSGLATSTRTTAIQVQSGSARKAL